MTSSQPPSAPGMGMGNGSGGEGTNRASGAASPTAASGERRFDQAVNATHEAVDRAAESLDHAADRMRQSYDRMCAAEKEWAEACRTQVREHPLAMVLAAVGVGVLIGCLASRSHHH